MLFVCQSNSLIRTFKKNYVAVCVCVCVCVCVRALMLVRVGTFYGYWQCVSLYVCACVQIVCVLVSIQYLLLVSDLHFLFVT